MKQQAHWMQTAVTIGTILPVVLALGGWILSRSNNSAVIADQVQDQGQEIKALQQELVQLELQQARESCRK